MEEHLDPGQGNCQSVQGVVLSGPTAQSVVRLLTPKGMRYEEAYAKAPPFNELKEDLLDPRMIQETVELMSSAVEKNVRMYVIMNNRAGGNAPLISQRIAERFLSSRVDRKG